MVPKKDSLEYFSHSELEKTLGNGCSVLAYHLQKVPLALLRYQCHFSKGSASRHCGANYLHTKYRGV